MSGGMITERSKECARCNGTGTIMVYSAATTVSTHSEVCPSCKGNGWVREIIYLDWSRQEVTA